MNVLFLTLVDFSNFEESNIYSDLMNEFLNENHYLCIISPTEKRNKEHTHIIKTDKYEILKLQVSDIQKTNIFKKGISTLTIGNRYTNAIKKYFSNITFDLVLYSTPPVTLGKAVKYIKNRDNPTTYLLLKDIFPQNAVDLQMIRKNGIVSILYRYFRYKEKQIYEYSDYIGCMSQANVDYLLKNNHGLLRNKVEVCPNSLEPTSTIISDIESKQIEKKYQLPKDKILFIYGGNLGKPQGVDFLIECLRSNIGNDDVFFLVVGSGTDYYKIVNYANIEKPQNLRIIEQLPNYEFERLVNVCDVGLIFLDYRFTIPNFPSKILSYMRASKSILAATDINSDIGKTIKEGKFGYWCESLDKNEFNNILHEFYDVEKNKIMGSNARLHFEKHFTAKHSYEVIINHFK